MSQASNIPLPADPRHQRFADLRMDGKSLIEAYIGAGYSGEDRKRSSNAKRIEDREDVRTYMEAVRQAAAQGKVMSEQFKREFLCRVCTVPLIAIDPTNPQDPNADLVRKFKRRVREGSEEEPEAWICDEFEKLDPLKAIALDNQLTGEDPAAKAAEEFAKFLSTMRNTP